MTLTHYYPRRIFSAFDTNLAERAEAAVRAGVCFLDKIDSNPARICIKLDKVHSAENLSDRANLTSNVAFAPDRHGYRKGNGPGGTAVAAGLETEISPCLPNRRRDVHEYRDSRANRSRLSVRLSGARYDFPHE